MSWFKIKEYFLEKDLILYDIMDKIDDFYYNAKHIIHNIKLYFPIILHDRWWDYSYFEELIIHKLKNLEEHWGKDTHYVGDCFTKGRIKVLLRQWERIEKMEDDLSTILEARKEKELWFKRFSKLLPKLWD